MKVLFAGTPDFAVAPLKALCESHTVVGVFTQPDRKAGRGKKLTPPPVKVFAEQYSIPVYQPTTLANQQQTIKNIGADVMVVVAYGMLLPQDILDTPPLGCINIHASLLPRWRGAAPIQRAIEAGDRETGVSIMRMEIGLDTGPVFETLSTPIKTKDTSSSLHDTLAALGAQGICNTLNALANTNHKETATVYLPHAQDHSQANYAKKIHKTEAEIDWSDSCQQIDQRIRAFIPWPVSQTHHNQTRIRIWQATPLTRESASTELTGTAIDKPNGSVVSLTENGLNIRCGDGFLCIERLQRDGSTPLLAKQFCNGYPLKVGDVLSKPMS